MQSRMTSKLTLGTKQSAPQFMLIWFPERISLGNKADPQPRTFGLDLGGMFPHHSTTTAMTLHS